MAVITLTLNDELVTAQEDQSLLQVAREQGLNIPTLCHLEGLEDRGGCRLCMVEIENNPKLQAACVTQPQEGMIVRTHTDKLVKYRQMIIELLLSERNHVCSVCVMNGNCELQYQTVNVAVDHVRYDYLHPDLTMDASHPLFTLDHNRCILCTRCVRVCDEVEGAHTWDVAGRGVNSWIVSDLNTPWGSSQSCTSCGKCVQVCPTGALTKKGMTVAEMEKQHDFLSWILEGREKNVWQWREGEKQHDK